MTLEDHLRFNATAPTAAGLAAMGRQVVGRPVAVGEVRRLTGGVDAATHAVRLDPGGWVVVKRGRAPQAASLAREYERLRFVERAPVATPAALALDAAGDWFGHPAFVMGRLPGGSAGPDGTGPWIERLAETLAAVHATPLDGEVPAVLRAPHAGTAWEPAPPAEVPRSARMQALVDAGLALAERVDRAEQTELTGSDDVLLHHDFHRRNVLWRADRVTGVVDWNEARLGPAACDVAYCSVDLAMLDGLAAAARFEAAYLATTARELPDLDRWRCLWIANARRWLRWWLAAFREGGSDVGLPLARRRLAELADRSLAGLDGT